MPLDEQTFRLEGPGPQMKLKSGPSAGGFFSAARMLLLEEEKQGVRGTYFVRVQIPDYIAKKWPEMLKHETLAHAEAECALNGCWDFQLETLEITELPDGEGDLTNYSQVLLEATVQRPTMLPEQKWKAMEYPDLPMLRPVWCRDDPVEPQVSLSRESWILAIDDHFSAAHYLPNHDKCGRVHGHNYGVTVEFQCWGIDDGGMAADFHDLKELVRSVVSPLDHEMLNSGLGDWAVPTAESIARYIYRRIDVLMPLYPGLQLSSVTVEEVEGCRVTYRGPGS